MLEVWCNVFVASGPSIVHVKCCGGIPTNSGSSTSNPDASPAPQEQINAIKPAPQEQKAPPVKEVKEEPKPAPQAKTEEKKEQESQEKKQIKEEKPEEKPEDKTGLKIAKTKQCANVNSCLVQIGSLIHESSIYKEDPIFCSSCKAALTSER